MNFSTTNPSPIRRWLDAFVAMPDRIRLPLAVVLALLVHGLVMVAVWVWPLVASLLQKILPESITTSAFAPPPPPQEKQKLEVILMTPTPPPAEEKKELTVQEQNLLEEMFRQLPEEKQQEYMDVEGLAKKKNLSKHALLESWQDSVAGTKKTGNGDGALPGQDGRADLPFTHFKSQQANVGDLKIPAAPRPMPSTRPPGIEPPPIYKPRPVSKADLAAAQNSPDKIPKTADPAPAEQPTPTPPPRPAPMQIAKATPPPAMRKVIEASEDQIALYLRQPEQTVAPVEHPTLEPIQKTTPTPKPTPQPTVKPTPQPTPKPEAKPTPPISEIVAVKNPRPQPVQNPGYTQHMEQRKIEGGNAPAGDNGVDAAATVRGRYVKGVNQAIGSRWNLYVHDSKHGSLIAPGSVTLRFTLNAKGKVMKVQLLDNTSNSAHAALCERSFYDAQADIQPPPSELLKNGTFEDTFTFTLY